MTRSVVCVSHQTGAGGRELAAALAEQLGYRFVDEEVIARAAENGDVTVEELADAERRTSFLTRLIDDFGRSGGAVHGLAGVPHELLVDVASPAQLRGAIREAIVDLAGEGRIVVVSHAASHALTGDDVLRVLVVAPDDVRIERIAAAEGCDARTAADTLARHDAARRDYLKRFYGVGTERPEQYDLVVNTGSLDAASLVPLLADAATR